IEAARGAAAREHPRPGPLVLARAVRDRESRPVPRRADLIVEEGPVAVVPESLTMTGLGAPGRSPEIPEAADAYGWLVGSWELDVRHYGADVTALHIEGEAHFGWTLEGRAVQDVWIMPRRSARAAGLDKTRNMYGTTLRVW